MNNTQWTTRLEALGAKVDEHGNTDFTDAKSMQASVLPGYSDAENLLLMDLSSQAVVDVTGADAAQFMQAQFCNDVTSLMPLQAQINGFCTPKGRLHSLFLLMATEAGFRMVLPASVHEDLVKRLRMFAGLPLQLEPSVRPTKVKRADVVFTQRPDLICCGVAVSNSADEPARQLQQLTGFTDLPAQSMQLLSDSDRQLLRWHEVPQGENSGGLARYLYIADVEHQSALWESKDVLRSGNADWRWGDMLAGIPQVIDLTQEQFIPQMINLQLIDALSFKKGCFPGQEIVARMQYLGKLKKHMQLFFVDNASQAAAPGSVIVTDTDNNAGMVVDAVASDKGVLLLAVVNKAASVSDLRLNGDCFSEKALPYVMPDGKIKA